MTNSTHLLFDTNAVKSESSEWSSEKALKTYYPPMLVPLYKVIKMVLEILQQLSKH